MVDRTRRVPPWAWLTIVVAASIVFRAWLGSRMPAPFIFTDELLYQENARSLAAGDGIRVRDEAYGVVSVLYPLLLAPAYVLFDSLPEAYAAAKTINAIVMSLAAVPAYLVARRLLPSGWSLLAALFAVVLPSLAYTGTLMSENAFYPAFLLAVWALLRVLDEPTLTRQLVLLGTCALVTLVRVQGLALVLASVTAPLLLRLVASRPLRPFVPLFGLVAGGSLLVAATQLARGMGVSSLFGAYAVVGDETYDAAEVVKFLFWHLAELDLYVGVVPLAALLVLVIGVRGLEPRLQAFVAATLAVGFWTLLVVAAFASRFAGAIEERNMFVLAPLLLTGLLVWIQRGAPRPAAGATVAAALAAALPAFIPYGRFLQLKVRSDTLMLVPLWNVQDAVGLPRLDDVVLLAGLVAGGAFLFLPNRYLLALPTAVLAYFALAVQPIQSGPHGMERAAAEALFEGIRTGDRDWIDDAVPAGASVAAVWTGRTHRFTVNQLEFFNRSIGRVYTLGGPMPGGLPEIPVFVDERTGRLVQPNDAIAQADYAYADGSVALAGEPVARDERLGLTLYRTSGPLISTTSVEGVYNDQWSGREVTYRRVRCRGGTLTVTLESDPALFDEPQRVTAVSSGRTTAGRVSELAFVRVPPDRPQRLAIPLVADDGVCTVRFTIEPTRVPGGGDTRQLGIHFRAFEYEP